MEQQLKPPVFFTKADKRRMFTRAQIQERLSDTCGADWFIQFFQLTPLYNGRLFLGSQILRALESDPPKEQTEHFKPAIIVEAYTPEVRQPKHRGAPATCAGMGRLTRGKARP